MWFRLIAAQCLAGIGVVCLGLAIVLGLATPAFAQTPTTCVNGGGGFTTCVAKPSGLECTEATEGKRCDTPVACRCVAGVRGCPCSN